MFRSLSIKEAVEDQIKLTDVPETGATAFILAPETYKNNDKVYVYIVVGGHTVLVGRKEPVGEPFKGMFEVSVEKSKLEYYEGETAQFHYLWTDDVGNEDQSDSVFYRLIP